MLQVSRSNKFTLQGLFLSLLDESPLQVLFLVRSPVPQVRLQEVHFVHSDNSILSERMDNLCRPDDWRIYNTKYERLNSLITWTFVFIA